MKILILSTKKKGVRLHSYKFRSKAKVWHLITVYQFSFVQQSFKSNWSTFRPYNRERLSPILWRASFQGKNLLLQGILSFNSSPYFKKDLRAMKSLTVYLSSLKNGAQNLHMYSFSLAESLEYSWLNL